MAQMKAPCVRNIPRFKHGCPEKSWDGESGCPCWIEMSVSSRGNPKKQDIRKQCLDFWTWEFQWAVLGLLEGNQQAVESFRNNMTEVGPDGNSRPKPDPAIIALCDIMSNIKRIGMHQTVEALPMRGIDEE